MAVTRPLTPPNGSGAQLRAPLTGHGRPPRAAAGRLEPARERSGQPAVLPRDA
jgi:hypothetical protein